MQMLAQHKTLAYFGRKNHTLTPNTFSYVLNVYWENHVITVTSYIEKTRTQSPLYSGLYSNSFNDPTTYPLPSQKSPPPNPNPHPNPFLPQLLQPWISTPSALNLCFNPPTLKPSASTPPSSPYAVPHMKTSTSASGKFPKTNLLPSTAVLRTWTLASGIPAAAPLAWQRIAKALIHSKISGPPASSSTTMILPAARYGFSLRSRKSLGSLVAATVPGSPWKVSREPGYLLEEDLGSVPAGTLRSRKSSSGLQW